MNLNDYILEGMSDIDVSDIEITQAFAEMAVLEAMMNCYEKQIVMCEYNVDSTEEILMESASSIPYLESGYWVTESFIDSIKSGFQKAKQYFATAKKTIAAAKTDKKSNPADIKKAEQKVAETEKVVEKLEAEVKKAENDTKRGISVEEAAKNIAAVIKQYQAELEAKAKESTAAVENVAPPAQQGQVSQQSHIFRDFSEWGSKGVSGTTTYKGPKPMEYTNVTDNIPMGSMDNKDIKAYNKRSTFAKKSFANSLDRFFARAGYVIKKVVATIIDLFTNINWDKYKKALEKKLDSTNEEALFLTKAEFNAISAMTYVDDKVVEFRALFTVEYFKNKNWTVGLEKQEVGKINAYINDIKKYVASPDQYSDKDSSTSISQAEIIQMVDTLSSNKSKKTIREMQKVFAKFNIDENPDSGIPASVGVAMRKLLDLLAKYYTKTSAAFKKMINKIVDDKEFDDVKLRDQNSNINFELGGKGLRDEDERSGKSPATHRNFGRSIQKTSSDDAYTPNGEQIGGAKAAWSMNLDEDSDFF